MTLISGSPVHDVKVELTPQSVFYGKVIDDQGDPVMGAQVTVLVARIAEGRVSFQRSQSGITNDLGEYRLSNLARGKYIVCADLRDGFPRSGEMVGQQTCYPGPVEGGSASAMDLPAGREIKVDFTLRQAPAVHVRGTVTGLPEERNIGLSMVARGVSTGLVNAGGGNVRGGKFDFAAAAGSYMISADYFEGGKHLLARVPIEVGASDIDNVVVSVDSGFTVTGLVRIRPAGANQLEIAIRDQPAPHGAIHRYRPDQVGCRAYVVRVQRHVARHLPARSVPAWTFLREERDAGRPGYPQQRILRLAGGGTDRDRSRRRRRID